MAARRKDGEEDRALCKTRYPIVLVHGIFARDWKWYNCWGRIPKTLARRGAVLYYGGQQSAAPVAVSAAELKERVLGIVGETGCQKVNLIAHSKGGLDCRYAISRLGLAPYVASLTTVNTPHRGCVFVQEALEQIPVGVTRWIEGTYNRVYRLLGDLSPDFLGGVADLTAERCARFNEETPDAPDVLYQSVVSSMERARVAPPPFNLTWLIVRRYDRRASDGLVTPESARWGRFLGCMTAAGRRGISHVDMTDQLRRNIPGFDVRAFYVNLVRELKEKGL